MDKFYITTSIPYANAFPHIGFALELIQTDVIARYHRKKGKDVFFLTGTDEQGIKIQNAADSAGVSSKEFVDTISAKFKDLKNALSVSADDFIRTTDQVRHWPAAQEVWKRLEAQGDVYLKPYEGLYCSGCEVFLTEKELLDGVCSIHKKAPEQVSEENYFFRLSKYQGQIEKAIEKGRFQIIPAGRKREIIALLNQGLQDVSFSRPREKLSWGVPVPGDDKQVMYVWADALVNYLSGIQYPDGERFKKYWPADVHVVGKDIIRFHATIWPAMLLSLGLELPKSLFVHGFITVDGHKMSKSLGNVIDPFTLIEKYGTDAVRYFFLRELPAAEDGDFTKEKFEARYNSDLASGLGNLVSRVLTLAEKTQADAVLLSGTLEKAVSQGRKQWGKSVESFEFHEALSAVWGIIGSADKYIEEHRPWEESESQKQVIGELLSLLKEVADLLEVFLPETAEKILNAVREKKAKSLFPRLS